MNFNNSEVHIIIIIIIIIIIFHVKLKKKGMKIPQVTANKWWRYVLIPGNLTSMAVNLTTDITTLFSVWMRFRKLT